MVESYSPAQLARLGLPGVPGTKRGVQLMAKRQGWLSEPREGRGGGRRYLETELPPEAQAALAMRQPPAPRQTVVVAEPLEGRGLPAMVPPAPPLAPAEIRDADRACRDARAAILAEVDRLEIAAGLTQGQAVDRVCAGVRDATLSPELAALLPVAARKGGRAALCRSTIYGWLKRRADQGIDGLLPGRRARAPLADWVPAFLALHQTPSKPSAAACLEKLRERLPPQAWPSIDQVRREIKKLDAVTLRRGRHGARAAKAYRAFHARDVSDLAPGDIYCADGHKLDLEVLHPFNGSRKFRPEITTVIDVKTRRAVGWSADLTENGNGVLLALGSACRTAGIPGTWYCDNGSGFNGKFWDAPVTGVLGRWGITKMNSLPNHSQSRGVVERSHQSIWVREAKWLPTFMGDAMDAEARNRVHKRAERDLKNTGTSPLLMTWDEFLTWGQACIDAYNNRPHSFHRKIRGEDGRLRHLTPHEAWAEGLAALAEQGQALEPLSADDAADLLRPAEMRKIRRGMVVVGQNSYAAAALELHDGETVQVVYDPHDATKVWLRDRDGRPICEAAWEANRTSYMPISQIQANNRRRDEQATKRLQAKIDKRAPKAGPITLTEDPELMRQIAALPAPAGTVEPLRLAAPVESNPVAVPATGAPAPDTPAGADPDPRPVGGPEVFVPWAARRIGQLNLDDAQWLVECTEMEIRRQYLRMEGVEDPDGIYYAARDRVNQIKQQQKGEQT